MEDLPYVIYACFVLHNFCELSNETISEEQVRSTVAYDRDFQLETLRDRQLTSSNEAEGKRVKKIVTKYFDP